MGFSAARQQSPVHALGPRRAGGEQNGDRGGGEDETALAPAGQSRHLHAT
jgi:hypothetical protein